MSRVLRAVAAGVREAGRDDPPPPPVDPTEPVPPSEWRLIAADVYRTHRARLAAWPVLAALVVLAVAVRRSATPAWELLPAVAVAPMAGYWLTVYWLTDRAVDRRKLDEGQTTGKVVARIRARAAGHAWCAALAAVWLVVVAAVPPHGVAGALVWGSGGVVWGLSAWRVWWRMLPDMPVTTIPATAPATEPATVAEPATATVDHDPAWPVVAAANPPRRVPRQPATGPATATGSATPPPATATRRRAPITTNYQLPDLGLLAASQPPQPRTAHADAIGNTIQDVLDEHRTDATVRTRYRRGPTVTLYAVEPGPGVKVERITGLTKTLTTRLGAPVRIYTPIPGDRGAIGIEVPNPDRDTVTLGAILRSRAAQATANPMLVGLGMDIAGQPVLADIAKWIHLLIGGATGGGKSGVINAILCSLLARATPEQLGLLLIDPKRVELTPYEGVPHLIRPVITNPVDAAHALGQLTAEVDRRYDRLQAAGVRHIGDYNRRAATDPTLEPMRYLVAIVDELADLMAIDKGRRAANAGQEPDVDEPPGVEDSIVRGTQLARACGVHYILATQRPEVKVVTGLIKANVPSRLAFAVRALVDSRIILDESGAETLAGQGDSLYRPAGSPSAARVQAAWVTDAERDKLVAHCRAQGRAARTTDDDPGPAATAPRPAGTVVNLPARAVVMAAARRLAADTGNPDITREQLITATPELSDAARNAAFTELTAADRGLLVRVRNGLYRLPTTTRP